MDNSAPTPPLGIPATANLYLLRHGETEWNRAGRWQGRGDSPLTSLGVAQARAYGEWLAARVDPARTRLVTSPLGRARRTAEIIAQRLALPAPAFAEEPLLAEHHFGLWEGHTSAEVEVRFPGEQDRRRADRWSYVIPGGESYALVHARILTWAARQPFDRPLIVVTHEMVSRVLQGFLRDLPREQTLELRHAHGRLFHFANVRLVSVDVSVVTS